MVPIVAAAVVAASAFIGPVVILQLQLDLHSSLPFAAASAKITTIIVASVQNTKRVSSKAFTDESSLRVCPVLIQQETHEKIHLVLNISKNSPPTILL